MVKDKASLPVFLGARNVMACNHFGLSSGIIPANTKPSIAALTVCIQEPTSGRRPFVSWVTVTTIGVSNTCGFCLWSQ